MLRRTRPNFIVNEIGDVTIKNDINENQGDDEAEDISQDEQEEEDDNETRNEKFNDYPKKLSENENENDEEDKILNAFESELSDTSPSSQSRSKRNNLNRKSLTSRNDNNKNNSSSSNNNSNSNNSNSSSNNSSNNSSNSSNNSNSNSSGIEEDFESTSKIDSLPQPSTKINSSGNEPVYCICKGVSFGQMIACDGQECPVEWFHSTCVGLKSLPKGKWYCKGCQERLDSKTAAQMAVGTRSTRNRS